MREAGWSSRSTWSESPVVDAVILDELDEHAVGAARVEERDSAAVCAGTRFPVDELDAGGGQVREHLFEIGDTERDVVQAWPAALEKTAHRRLGRERLDELDAR